MLRILTLSASVQEFVLCCKMKSLSTQGALNSFLVQGTARTAPAKMSKYLQDTHEEWLWSIATVDICKLCHIVETSSQTRLVRIQRCSIFTASLSCALSLLSSAAENVRTWFGQMLIILVSSLKQGSSVSLFLSNTSPHESCSMARTPRQYVNTNNK